MATFSCGRLTILERAARYLSAMPPAIEGQKGDWATYNAARAAVNGFSLDETDALVALQLYYNPRCVPPWSEVDLRRKVRSTLKRPGNSPRGYLLGEKSCHAEKGLRPVQTAEQLARLQEFHDLERLEASAREKLPHILASLQWPSSQIFSDSPVALSDDPENDWQHLLSLFRPDENVWIGDTKESGYPRFARNFRTAAQWMTESSCPVGPFILPAVLKPGVWSRTQTDIQRLPYLVVESDVLVKDEIGAVFRWLRENVGLTLRAVVDTGSRSLHGWFARPDPVTLAELRAVLPALACDGFVLRDTQPVRLPGCLRPGKDTRQALLFLDREAAHD